MPAKVVSILCYNDSYAKVTADCACTVRLKRENEESFKYNIFNNVFYWKNSNSILTTKGWVKIKNLKIGDIITSERKQTNNNYYGDF